MRSRTRSGVASIPWYDRVQVIAARIGKLAFDRGDLHRRRGEHPRRDELEIGHAERRAAAIHELPEADAERGEVQHRIEQAGHERAAPDAAIGVHPVLVRAERSSHQSTRVRPVSRRKTSSSVERRTSTLCGCSRSCAIGTSASPSSVYSSSRSGSTLDARDACRRTTPGSTSGATSWKRSSTTSRVESLLDELERRALLGDLAAVHDDEPVAELLGLVHVVGREHERHAALLQPEEAIPDDVPRLRIEPGRRLVEQQHLGVVDERRARSSGAASCRRTAARPCCSRARRAARTRGARRAFSRTALRERPK